VNLLFPNRGVWKQMPGWKGICIGIPPEIHRGKLNLRGRA